MAELKTLAPPPTSAKEAFVGTAGKKTEKKARPQVKKLSDNSGRYIKIGLYGDYGVGKTYGLVDLLTEFGLKILVVNTDVGGDGLSTVIAELQARGRGDLADTNIVHVTLPSYDDMSDFVDNPALFFEDIYTWDPDMLVWDGFSSFQQNQVFEYVETLDEVHTKEGNLDTQKYWGAIKKATVAMLNRFLYTHNKRNGKLWHKYVTILSSDIANEETMAKLTDEKERRKVARDIKSPFVQGSAAKLIGPAFDFFAYCKTGRVDDPKDPNKKITQFQYVVEPSKTVKAKVRGVRFEPVIKADMGEVWGKLTAAYMIKPGQQSSEIIEETAA